MSDAEILARHGHHLTPKEREAVELYYVRGISQRTVALQLGISREALRSRLESARRKLEQALRSEAA